MSLKDDEVLAAQAMLERSTSGPAISLERLRGFVEQQVAPGRSVVNLTPGGGARKAGLSSGTLLFDVAFSDGRADTSESLVFRYDMGGTMFSQYDLPIQFHIMRAVGNAGFPVPDVLWLDEEGTVAGGGRPGLVMRRVEAPAPSATPFVDGPYMDTDADGRRRMMLAAATVIGKLHQLDPEALGLDVLKQRGAGRDALERELAWNQVEVDRATLDQNGQIKTDIARRQRRVLEAGAKWLRENAPDRSAEIVHGDPNITNFLHRGEEVASVLDWELTHLGVGEEDLAYLQACITSYARSVGGVDGIPTEAELIAAYEKSGRKLRDWQFARGMANWRIGCISAVGFSKYPASAQALMEDQWGFIENQLVEIMGSQISE